MSLSQGLNASFFGNSNEPRLLSDERIVTHEPDAWRITPHLERVLPHPRGEIQPISPHPIDQTEREQTTYSERVGRNCLSFAPHEKRKNFVGAKIMSWARSPAALRHAHD
jgi:hypothetical protein